MRAQQNQINNKKGGGFANPTFFRDALYMQNFSIVDTFPTNWFNF